MYFHLCLQDTELEVTKERIIGLKCNLLPDNQYIIKTSYHWKNRVFISG